VGLDPATLLARCNFRSAKPLKCYDKPKTNELTNLKLWRSHSWKIFALWNHWIAADRLL